MNLNTVSLGGGVDFSTTNEIFTGMKWNSYPIYQKVFIKPSVSLTTISTSWDETVNNSITRAWIANGSYILMKGKNDNVGNFYSSGVGYYDGSNFSCLRIQFKQTINNFIRLELWSQYYQNFNFEACFVIQYY